MKKKLLFIVLISMPMLLNAQVSSVPPDRTIIDLSTGLDQPGPPPVPTPIGAQDPYWLVTTAFVPGTPTANVISSRITASTTCTNQWIHANRSVGTFPPGDRFVRPFYFETQDGCILKDVNLDIEVWADGMIDRITYNGLPLFRANPPLLPTPVTKTINTVVTNNTNTDSTVNDLTIVALNSGVVTTGLQVCGEVEMVEVCCDPGKPNNVSTVVGQGSQTTLSWSDNSVLNDNNSFILEITYNDPFCDNIGLGDCCSGPVSSLLIPTSATSYTFTPAQTCFSWRVAAKCARDGIMGAWSNTSYCQSSISTPFNLSRTINLLNPPGGTKLDWDYVGSTVTGFEVEVKYNHSQNSGGCCTGLESTSTFFATNSELIFVPQTACFSFRVKGNCGDWSEWQCEDNRTQGTSSGGPPGGPPMGGMRKEGQQLSDNGGQSLITVAPNPTKGIFNISVKENKNFHYTVLDVKGQTVIDQVLSHQNNIEVDLSDQPNGIYFLHVINNADLEVIKIIKQ